ncbi:MAG: hypothetical protein J6X55_00245 [Victivallales bacterium]|nr:hypothetical protein [Victivallales bacterium]
MKHTLLALFCIISLMAVSSPIFESIAVHTQKGIAYLDRNGTEPIHDDFTEGLSKWTVVNYENLLTIKTEVLEGENACVISLKRAKCDNAWELGSKPFKVIPGSDFTIAIRARGTINMAFPHGHGNSYKNSIIWYDKDGKELDMPFPYAFPTTNDKWTNTYIDGSVPDGADTAAFFIGADGPNFDPDDTLAISKVTLFVRDASLPCVPEGSFISAPILTDSPAQTFSWDAETQNNGILKFQLAFADDKRGIPGDFSDFTGPDGTENTFYTTSGTVIKPAKPWVRYKAFFTSNGSHTPLLKSVTIGNTTHGSWTNGDFSSPKLVMLTESPNQHPELPIRFRIDDESPIDWTSFKCFFDQEDVTAKIKRNGNEISYQEDKPFSQPGVSMNPLRWNIGNYENRLTFNRLEDISNAVRVELRGEKEWDTSFAITSMPIPVFSEKEYTFRIRVRHNMDLKGKEPSRNKIVWLDKELKPIGKPAAVIEFGPATTDWITYEHKLTPPADARAVQVNIGFDVPIIHVGEFFDMDSLQIDGAIPETQATSTSIPHIHTLEVSGKDIFGNSLADDRTMFFGESVKKNIVTMRDDGFVLIDGKPFFPIGLYGMSEKPFNNNSYDKAFKDLRANGFNFAHTYKDCGNGPNRQHFLDTAAANGIKVWVPLAGGLVDCTLRERNHPAILAWYLGDDTATHIPADVVRRNHLKCHAIDNAHLTTQADAVGGYYTNRYIPYVHSTDSFMPEIYPVTSPTPLPVEVPAVIRDMKACQYALRLNGSPVKTFWAIIQHFKGYSSWKRFPSFAELRAMSYLSIIHGAHGITWYTYGGNDTTNLGVASSPERWNEICTVARELSSLSSKITSRNAKTQPNAKVIEGPQTDGLKFPSINCLLKDNDGDKILMTANSSNEPIKAQISLKGFKSADVLFENRTVQLDNDGNLIDDFAQFGVHIYKLKK